KELLKECEKIGPAAVKRANTFFPGSPAAPSPPTDKATQLESNDAPVVATAEPRPLPDDEVEFAAALPARGQTARANLSKDAVAAALNEGADQAAAIRKT